MPRRHVTTLACATVIAAFAALLPASAGYAAPAGPCAETSSTTVLDVTTLQCDRFYDDIAVQLPSDSATTVYGIMGIDLTSFETRTKTFPVRPRAVPQELTDNSALASQLFLVATVRDGQVTRLRPYLMISGAAILEPYTRQQSTGKVNWMSPPSGIRTHQWTRIRFQGSITADELSGRIVNYRSGVLAGGRCRAALRSGAAGASYRTFFGPTGAFTATWFPAMHAPRDSEVNLQLSSGINYMTAGPQLPALMKGAWHPIDMSLLIHGTPIGTPSTITGTLAPRTRTTAC